MSESSEPLNAPTAGIHPRKHVWIEVTFARGGERAKLHTSVRPIRNGERIQVPYGEAKGYVERGVAKLIEDPYQDEAPKEIEDAASPDD